VEAVLFLDAIQFLIVLVPGSTAPVPSRSSLFLTHFFKHSGIQFLFLFARAVFRIAVKMLTPEAKFADEFSTTGTFSRFQTFLFSL
jgi:hypothetical protein